MQPNTVAIDPSNRDVVVVGTFGGSIDFGGGLLTSHGDAGVGYDAFIARFNSAGAYQWAHSFGNGAAVSAGGAAVSLTGNVVVGGAFQGSVNLGCGVLTAVGSVDLFLASFSSSGGCIWSERFGSSGQSQNMSTVAVDGSGNALIAGQGNSVDFGGGAGTGFYLAKFDPSGIYTWSHTFPATSTQGGPWLALDGQGNAILAGSFNTTVNFGGGTLTNSGPPDAFVAKFDPSGAYQWARQYGDDVDVHNVATDACNNILATGNFGGVANFGTGNLAGSTTAPNNYLAKISPSGSGVWADAFTGSTSGSLGAGSVAVGGSGEVTITSALNGMVNYGGGALSSVGTGSVAIASFDSAGRYGWAYAAGSPSTIGSGPSTLKAVAASATSIVLIGTFGTYQGSNLYSPPGTTIVLAGRTLTAAAVDDVFIASFAP
jgi:hypothetical protein